MSASGASFASSATFRGWMASPTPSCANGSWPRFDEIWIDNCNGDKYRTGKRTPDGRSDRVDVHDRHAADRHSSRYGNCDDGENGAPSTTGELAVVSIAICGDWATTNGRNFAIAGVPRSESPGSSPFAPGPRCMVFAAATVGAVNGVGLMAQTRRAVAGSLPAASTSQDAAFSLTSIVMRIERRMSGVLQQQPLVGGSARSSACARGFRGPSDMTPAELRRPCEARFDRGRIVPFALSPLWTTGGRTGKAASSFSIALEPTIFAQVRDGKSLHGRLANGP